MASSSRHISIHIDRPAAEVYDFAADPRNLRRWAAGLAGATVEYAAEAVAADLATLRSVVEGG